MKMIQSLSNLNTTQQAAKPVTNGHTSRLNDISAYQGVEPAVVADGTWQQAIEVIRSDKYDQTIKKIRAIKNTQDEKAYREAKKKLPAVTFGGTFNGIRSNETVQFPTGFIVPDIDHIKDVENKFSDLIEDEHIWFAFKSPGGDGIKCGLRSEDVCCDAEHKQLYYAVEKYLNDAHGITIDTACKDISRLTFMSHDADAYINENACYFDHGELELPQPEPQRRVTTDSISIKNDIDSTTESITNPRKQKYGQKVLESACDKIRASQPGEQHQTRIEQATLVGGFIPTEYIDRDNALSQLERAVADSGAADMRASMKDITDGIAYGQSKPLDPIAEAAAEREAIQEESKAAEEAECYLEALTYSDGESSDCYEWLIEKLVPLGEPMIIGGKGSSGKTTLALEFSAQILENDPVAAVVYICAEGTYRDTKIRARQMGLTQYNRFFFLKRKGGTTSFKLSEKTDLKLVVDVLKKFNSSEFKIALVVIDSIRGMQRGSLSDDAVGEVMQDINSAICQEIGATVQYIHHSKKNTDDITAMDALLGSVTIVNSVRHALFIRKLSGRVREVEVCKSNLGFEDHFFKATLDDNKRINLEHRGLLDEKDDETDPSQIDKAEEIILSMIGGGDWVAAYEIYRRGEMEEISVETIKRAKKLYDIEVKKRGKIWMWRLKPQKEEGQGEGEGLTPLTPLRAKQPELFDKEEGQEGGQASEG